MIDEECASIPTCGFVITELPVKRHRGERDTHGTHGTTGKKTPGGAGTHTGHTGHTGARGQTDHTDEPQYLTTYDSGLGCLDDAVHMPVARAHATHGLSHARTAARHWHCPAKLLTPTISWSEGETHTHSVP